MFGMNTIVSHAVTAPQGSETDRGSPPTASLFLCPEH